MTAQSNVIAIRAPSPIPVNGKVNPPRRVANAERRSREHLTEAEVTKLMKAAGSIGRHGVRDRALILIAFRHGLRVSELVALRWDQVVFGRAGTMHVNRAKGGVASTHPISGPVLRALRDVQRAYPDSPYVFSTELGGPMTTSTVRKLVARAGELAKLPFPVHPHMLRHACGFKLANDGVNTRVLQSYLGHKNIQHTVRYTELAPGQFKDFWKD